jgi:hypothetical protein
MQVRFIDLSCIRFLKEIPETLCNLSNLQTLLLVRCKKLQKLPKAMGKLINLKNMLGVVTSFSTYQKGLLV